LKLCFEERLEGGVGVFRKADREKININIFEVTNG